VNGGLFDRAAEYDAMLQKGIGLSGENKEYFTRGRIEDLRRQLPAAFRPGRILDFGCGTGSSAAYLTATFPAADITGVDTSEAAIDRAAGLFGSSRVRFRPLAELAQEKPFDLCYVNGVFHHIEPAQRDEAARLIYDALEPGGFCALFENNPWNPGTRMVMKRIPFDRDAIPLSAPTARRLLRRAGFDASRPARFLFWFPRPLAALRFLEPSLAGLPFGAQYYLLAVKAEIAGAHQKEAAG